MIYLVHDVLRQASISFLCVCVHANSLAWYMSYHKRYNQLSGRELLAIFGCVNVLLDNITACEFYPPSWDVIF